MNLTTRAKLIACQAARRYGPNAVSFLRQRADLNIEAISYLHLYSNHGPTWRDEADAYITGEISPTYPGRTGSKIMAVKMLRQAQPELTLRQAIDIVNEHLQIQYGVDSSNEYQLLMANMAKAELSKGD